MTGMRTIQTGHPVRRDVEVVSGNFVRFVSPDGECQFEVRFLDDDGIEVRGVDSYMAGGQLVGCALSVEPRCSNVVHVRSVPLCRYCAE